MQELKYGGGARRTGGCGCGCGGSGRGAGEPIPTRAKAGAALCGEGCYERVAYYPGQFLTHTDLTADQAYLAAKRRLHNRNLHGHGIVCGLELTQEQPGSAKVTIDPGLALDPQGNEIYVPQSITVDLAARLQECAFGPNAGDCVGMAPSQPRDNWGYQTGHHHLTTGKSGLGAIAADGGAGYLYQALSERPAVVIALRYQEYDAAPEPAYTPQAGCETPCAYSRVREGYCVELLCLSDLPDECRNQLLRVRQSALSPDQGKDQLTLSLDPLCRCGNCGYVFLGVAVQVDQRRGMVLDPFTCLLRRYVLTFPRLFEWMATGLEAQTRQPLTFEIDMVIQALLCRVTGHLQLAGQAAGQTITEHALKQPQPADLVLHQYRQAMAATPLPTDARMQQRVEELETELARVKSPTYQLAGRKVAGKVALWQEPLALELAVAAAEELTVDEVDGLETAAPALQEAGVFTVAQLLNGGAAVHAALGDRAAEVLQTAEKKLTELSQGAVKGVKEAGAVDAAGLEAAQRKLADSLKLASGRLSGVLERVRRVHRA